MPWTFYNANGQRLSSAATNISVLDIDGATEINAAIVNEDLLIIDDGAGGTNRSVLASRIVTYVAANAQAVQSDIEAETNQDTYVPPDLIKHSPGVAKAYCKINATGALIANDYNIATIGDTGSGDRDVNFTIAMDNANYSTQVTLNSQDAALVAASTQTTADVRIISGNTSMSLADHWQSMVVFGKQA
jgi:hypothetical protein